MKLPNAIFFVDSIKEDYLPKTFFWKRPFQRMPYILWRPIFLVPLFLRCSIFLVPNILVPYFLGFPIFWCPVFPPPKTAPFLGKIKDFWIEEDCLFEFLHKTAMK